MVISIQEVSIVLGGILTVLMVFFHMGFYRIFHWEKGLSSVKEMNKRIVYSIHVALILMFLIFAVISFIYTHELARTDGLAFGIVLSYALFWLWRTIWQVVDFKPSKDHGKLLFMHYALVIIFLLLFVFYGIPVVMRFI